MVDFNAPIMEDESQASAVGSANGAAYPAELIDLNDPALASESLEGQIDETKDAYELPPPPPDAIYVAKLRIRQVKVGDGTDALADFKAGRNKQDGSLYLYTGIEAEIVDPSGKQDGKKIPDYFVSTMIRKDKSMQIATILHHAKVKAPAVKTHKAWMDTLLAWLRSEPTLKIQTSWEASWDAAIDEAEKLGNAKPRGSTIIGMHNFPVVKGQPSPEYKWPDRSVTRARARITRYLPL